MSSNKMNIKTKKKFKKTKNKHHKKKQKLSDIFCKKIHKCIDKQTNNLVHVELHKLCKSIINHYKRKDTFYGITNFMISLCKDGIVMRGSSIREKGYKDYIKDVNKTKLKSVESLSRKLSKKYKALYEYTDLKHHKDYVTIFKNIIDTNTDILRYTFIINEETYKSDLITIQKKLLKDNIFEEIKLTKKKNNWMSDEPWTSYLTNYQIKNYPSISFEVQFHTFKSHKIKENMHILYEINREGGYLYNLIDFLETKKKEKRYKNIIQTNNYSVLDKNFVNLIDKLYEKVIILKKYTDQKKDTRKCEDYINEKDLCNKGCERINIKGDCTYTQG
jgi:hypothetical protein